MKIEPGKRVYLSCGKTDMRKSINGLVTVVESHFKLNLYDGALFVFCNKNRDRLKVLEWDGDGYWLYLKRLERGHFRWPEAGEEGTMTLTSEELNTILSGTKIELKLRRKEVSERQVI
jgi:transposase